MFYLIVDWRIEGWNESFSVLIGSFKRWEKVSQMASALILMLGKRHNEGGTTSL